MKEERNACIHINPKDLSKLYANKKEYFNKLKENNKFIIVEQDDKIHRGHIKLCLKDKKLDIIY